MEIDHELTHKALRHVNFDCLNGLFNRLDSMELLTHDVYTNVDTAQSCEAVSAFIEMLNVNNELSTTVGNDVVAVSLLRIMLESGPLLDTDLYPAFLDLLQDPSDASAIDHSELRELIIHCPAKNVETFRRLCAFLNGLSRGDPAKMRELGILFSPTILRAPAVSMKSIMDLPRVHTIVHAVVANYEPIFALDARW